MQSESLSQRERSDSESAIAGEATRNPSKPTRSFIRVVWEVLPRNAINTAMVSAGCAEPSPGRKGTDKRCDEDCSLLQKSGPVWIGFGAYAPSASGKWGVVCRNFSGTDGCAGKKILPGGR